MVSKNAVLYQCMKCLKTSRDPVGECPVCKGKQIVKRKLVETKTWKN